MDSPFKSYSLIVIKNTLKKNIVQRNRSSEFIAKVFLETNIFTKHLQEVHSLPPVAQTQNLERKLHQESASDAEVQTYFPKQTVMLISYSSW